MGEPLAGLIGRVAGTLVAGALGSCCLLLIACLVIGLPWALRMQLSQGLWQLDESNRPFLDLERLTLTNWLLTIPWIPNTIFYQGSYLQDTATLSTHLQMAGLILALALGLTALALSWRVFWGIPFIANLWERLGRAWTRLHRTRAWRWLWRGLAWGLVLLLILDVVGIFLTASIPTD